MNCVETKTGNFGYLIFTEDLKPEKNDNVKSFQKIETRVFYSCRHYKLEAEIASMTWKVNWGDVITKGGESRGGKRGSLLSVATHRNSVMVNKHINFLHLAHFHYKTVLQPYFTAKFKFVTNI